MVLDIHNLYPEVIFSHASRKEASVQVQIKTLRRDQKVLAKMYGLYSGNHYGAKTCPCKLLNSKELVKALILN